MTVKEQVLKIYDARYNELTKAECEFLSGFFSSVAKYHTTQPPKANRHIETKTTYPPITMTRCGT